MEVKKTKFNGLIILEPKVFRDDRGAFFETYRDYILNNSLGKEVRFIQENQSVSKINVFRGLHFQTGNFAQAKLVRVVKGSVIDIVVDLRKDEITYGQHHIELLSDENIREMFIPRGFAHGFLTLSDEAIFQYKCDNYYNKEYEAGITLFDEELGIIDELAAHVIDPNELIVNERDRNFPKFKDLSLTWKNLNTKKE